MRRPHRNIEIFSMSALDLFASALGGFVLIAIILFPYYTEDKALMQRAEQAEQAAIDAAAAQAEAESAAEAAAEAQAEAEAVAAEQTAAAEAAAEALTEAEAEAEAVAEQLIEAQAEAEAALAAQVEAEAALGEAAELQTELEQTVSALRLEVARTFLIVVVEWDNDADLDLHVTDPEGRLFKYNTANRSAQNYPDTLSQLTVDNTYGPGIEVWQAPDATPGEYEIVYNLFSAPSGGNGEIPVNVQGSLFYRNGVEQLPVAVMFRTGENVVTTVTVTENGTLEIAPGEATP